MKKDEAARYVGMSVTSFDRAIEAGEYPPGQRRTGGTFWLRSDLETATLGIPVQQRDFSRAI